MHIGLFLCFLGFFIKDCVSERQSTIQQVMRFDEPQGTTTYRTTITHSTTTPPPTTTSRPDPPPKNETARMARYIVHYSDWCELAHISHHGNTSGYPAARVYSTADGFFNKSTGTPYFYVSKMDAHVNDLSKDSRCSVTISLAEGDYCRREDLDPEDPRCAQVILTGRFQFLDPDSPQGHLGKLYLYERHPVMKTWPKGHHWWVGRLKIGNIQVADNFGGSAYPSVEEYFNADPETET